MQGTEACRIGAEEALELSGTNKVRFTEMQAEFADRLRRLKIAKSFVIYSRSWAEHSLWVARSAVPADMPRVVRSGASDGTERSAKEALIDVNFGDCNVISRYSNGGEPSCVLHLRHDAEHPPLNLRERELLKRCFTRAYCTMLAIKRTEIRSQILTRARSDTLSRLADHSLDVVKSALACESVAIFFRHRNGSALLESLGSTNGIRLPVATAAAGGPRMRVVVPFGPEITDLLSTGTVMVQNNGESGRERREFDDVGHGPIRNVLYAPMTLQRELREFRVDRAIGGKQRASWRASGIVRVTNLLTGVRPDGHADQVPRLATWEDLYLLEFVAELIFVLSRALVEQGKYESELERALHGFRYLIRGATLNSTEVYRAITSGVENDARYRPLMLKDHPGGYYTVGRVQNFQADSMAFLEDMDAQMDKVTRRHVIERRPSVVIEHFHRDVLMVAVKNAERAVEIYDRRKVHFNSLADAGSLDIREVMGDASAFVAVFRNLFENSLKYARRNDAEPHIVLAVDLTKKHAVYVDVRDFGLGVTSTERQFLFTDGFRGSAAYAAGATGSGVGLVYSRQIMTAYGGELTLVKTPDDGRGGAKFRLTFKRRETRK